MRALMAIVQKRGGNPGELLHAVGLLEGEVADESAPIGLSTFRRAVLEVEKRYGKRGE